MQRFLPGQTTFDPLEDIVRPEVKRFQEWYKARSIAQYELVRRVTSYLIDKGDVQVAEKMLDKVWEVCRGNLEQEYFILNLRANARLRIPGKSGDAERDFRTALMHTKNPKAPETLKKSAGQAFTELGYYLRNTGNWNEAAYSYLEALRITPLSDPARRASIQSQYAYVQALKGVYQSAHDLVDTALSVRRKLGLRREEGMALSVKGEIHRYERHYRDAWQAYRDAKDIFDELEDWGWQGLVQQEMAICLYQAHKAGIVFPEYEKTPQKMLEDARDMILKAVEFCRDYSARNYPSALNRAGRIIGLGYLDYQEGLKYLEEGIDRARDVADGWFLFANLVQYAELSYQAWVASGRKEKKYLDNISARQQEMYDAYIEYNFPDLQGRWELLQGQLKADRAQAMKAKSKKEELINEAFKHFKIGYPLIAKGYIGSHGIVALPEELQKLIPVLRNLPSEKLEEWFEYLQKSWTELDKVRQETSLSSYLTELYLDVKSNSG
jgi:tetratricopeptide (TPR) repeat protein